MLTYKAKRRWSLLILLIGLPFYIFLAFLLMSLFPRPPIWAELLIYGFLGIAWAVPFRKVFRGVGQADPNEEQNE